MTKKFFAIIFIAGFIVSSVEAAPKKAAAESVIGTWKLESFMRITADNREIQWCSGANGYITYTPQGFMSVGINCAPNNPPDSPSHVYNDMLLYTAKYEVKGDTVIHHILNSSYPDFLGKDQIRKYAIADSKLTITGESKNGKFRIVWTRP